MKNLLQFLKKPLLAIAITAALEFLIFSLSNDHESCFIHNTFFGTILLWLARMVCFTVSFVLLTFLFLPKYNSVKDRMLNQLEQKEQKKAEEERNWKRQLESAIKQYV